MSLKVVHMRFGALLIVLSSALGPQIRAHIRVDGNTLHLTTSGELPQLKGE